jgi:hypothetical protein
VIRGVTITLILGLALLAVAVGLTLARSPMTVVRASGAFVDTQTPIAATESGADYCQAREILPRGTSAIRVSLFASIGPRVRVTVTSDRRTVASGEQASAWTGGVVTVPVRPLARPVAPVTVCASFRLRDGGVTVLGERTSAAIAARSAGGPLAGRMRIEYLRSGSRTWASLIGSIVRHMALGRATTGAWIVFVALALALAVAVLASSLILRDLP